MDDHSIRDWRSGVAVNVSPLLRKMMTRIRIA